MHDRTGIRDVGGNTTDDQTSTRKLVQNSVSLVHKNPQFEIDLRVEGVSQDAILQDEEKMNETNEELEKLRIGSCTKSIRDDSSNGTMIFSDETRRAIYEMSNMELIELKQTSATVQCSSCLKRVLEGVNMCQCGVWLRPNQCTMERIRIPFATLKTPYFRTTEIPPRGKKSVHYPCRQIMPKPWMHEEEQRKTAANSPLYWTDGRTTRSTELLNWGTVGLGVPQVPRLHLQDCHQL